jgi:bifunctional ADP-heptose synthase (sugar kinase/adenylyltransferase)
MTESATTQQPTSLKLLLIGDSCIDEYHYGTVDRISPEAPVPVLTITHTETKPGMAANVKSNLEAFGCNVDFITGNNLSIKKRFIDERSKQHILRVDDDKPSSPFDARNDILDYRKYDAVVLSDYNKGFITYSTVNEIRKYYQGPIFIDTKKKDLAKFDGCFVKINSHEYQAATSFPSSRLIVTQGSKGASYQNKLYPAAPVDVVDVCGAGDTFLAAFVFKYMTSVDIDLAINFANKASAISVQHSGVYFLTKDDISCINNSVGRQ